MDPQWKNTSLPLLAHGLLAVWGVLMAQFCEELGMIFLMLVG